MAFGVPRVAIADGFANTANAGLAPTPSRIAETLAASAAPPFFMVPSSAARTASSGRPASPASAPSATMFGQPPGMPLASALRGSDA